MVNQTTISVVLGSIISLLSTHASSGTYFDIPVPEGTVDGDEFMENFKIERYGSSAMVRNVISAAAKDLFEKRRFANDFERNKAKENFESGLDISGGVSEPLPKYLIYKFPFIFTPGSYQFKKGFYSITPEHRFLPDNLYPKERGAPIVQDPPQTSIVWSFKAGIFAGQELSGGKISVVLGHYTADWGGKGTTNLVHFAFASPDEFEKVLSNGKTIPRSRKGTVYYTGYGIYKVDPNSLNCMGGQWAGYLSSIGSFGCEIKAVPYQYILNNFLGSENYVVDMKTVNIGDGVYLYR